GRQDRQRRARADGRARARLGQKRALLEGRVRLDARAERVDAVDRRRAPDGNRAAAARERDHPQDRREEGIVDCSVLNVGYRSTNYWVVSAGRSRMLVDLGWPGTIGTMKANLQRMDVPLKELRYALATHYHIDHAGVAQDLKQLGVPLLVLETQVTAIPVMKTHTKPHDNYTDITADGNVVITFAESRTRLAGIGIAGEIVPTPGHSDDSVTLVLDQGAAF